MSRFKGLGAGLGVQGEGLGFGVWGLGLRVPGLVVLLLRVVGLGGRV